MQQLSRDKSFSDWVRIIGFCHTLLSGLVFIGQASLTVPQNCMISQEGWIVKEVNV